MSCIQTQTFLSLLGKTGFIFKSFKIYPQKVKYNSHIKTIINTGTNTANAVVSS